jgi:hypothetical protein
MSRSFNSVLAFIGALLLVFLLGACQVKTEDAAVENVEAQADNLDASAENAADAITNAADNAADNAVDSAEPPPPPPPPPPEPATAFPFPATDTGPPGNGGPPKNGAPHPDAVTANDVAPTNEAAPANAVAPADTAPAADQAEKGFGSFKELDDMEVDNWYTVEFFVAPDKEALKEEAEAPAEELTAPTAIYVAPLMRVTLLKDPGFEIRAKTDAVQTTGRDRRASWQWDVKPLTDGERTLYAKVEVLKRNPDGSLEATETRTRHVAVKIEVGTWAGFLIALKNAASLGDVLTTLFASWEKTLGALAALILALVGVIVAAKKLRKA